MIKRFPNNNILTKIPSSNNLSSGKNLCVFIGSDTIKIISIEAFVQIETSANFKKSTLHKVAKVELTVEQLNF